MPENFEPFNKIGLCFSGGGYRATFFSLGTSSYLNRIKFKDKPLLKNVIALSTVSGGTLFGVAFAKAVANPNFNYTTFYNQVYSSFEPKSDKLLKKAVAKLGKDKIWNTSDFKKRTLINAFALEYKSMSLFSGSMALLNGLNNDPKKTNTNGYNLKHVCFNSTEFSFGLPFRFQNTGLFGNQALNCSEINAIVDKVELSDVVASSSCFPLGFEPLVFPDDYFLLKDAAYDSLKGKKIFEDGVGIMDGGITDNQGIESMLNTHNRDPLDLIIVNDVASFKFKPWQQSSRQIINKPTFKDFAMKILNHFNIKWIYPLAAILGLAILILNPLVNKEPIIPNWPNIVGGILLGIGLILSALGLVAFKIKRRGLKWFNSTLKKTVPTELIKEVTSFQNLNIDLIKRLFSERVTSTVTMVNNIFLNQIRRLNYDSLYEKNEYKYKRITSTVDQLDGKDTVYKKFKINDRIKVKPSPLLKKAIGIAADTPTTLWWDKKDIDLKRMDNLIACGQITTCYNLLDYILKLPKEHSSKSEIKDLKLLLEKDWDKFNKNPMFIVKPTKKKVKQKPTKTKLKPNQ